MSMMIPVLAALLACVGDVGEGKVAAEIADAPAAPAKQAPAEKVNGKSLPIDVSKSTLKALGAKVSATHPILFHKWGGNAHIDSTKLVGLDFEIDMASLESDHPRLTQHLLQEDFFFVEKFPKATFAATNIAEGSDVDGMTHTVTGTLEIRGKAKQVTFPAKIAIGPNGVTANTEFTINRQDFAITYPGRADDLVQDNVVLTVDFVASAG